MSDLATEFETARDAITRQSRLRRMRLGQEAPEFVTLKSNPEIRVALVPLSERDFEYGMKAAMNLEAADNQVGIMLRDRWQQVCDLWNALREPHNIEQRVFKSAEEMVDSLEQVDINYLSECYMRMIDESSPMLDGMTEEQVDELKKALVTIDWSVLSGKAWWHLKQCLFYLGQGPLKVKLPGYLSTESLTTTNDESESTLDADQSST